MGERCTSQFITDQTWSYTDLVQCEKTAGHKKPLHSFTTHPPRGKPVIYTWTDKEATR